MKKYIILFVCIILFMSSCSLNKNNKNKISKVISDMESYSSFADITVYGNKGISYYKVRQYFKGPDKIRVETIEPGFLTGKIVVYNGDVWKVYHPLIKQIFDIENLRNNDQLVYLGIIQKDIFLKKGALFRQTSKNGKDYYEIRSTIPGESEYRKTAVLYLTKTDFLPEIMEILDNHDKLKVEIKYSGFKYNISLDNSLFNLE